MADEKPSQDEAPKQSLYKRVMSYRMYPRAHESQVPFNDPTIRGLRLNLVKAAVKNFIFLQILFFALFCYIFGSLYREDSLTHRMNFAFVDYDGGAVGESIRAAYQNAKGEKFPTMIEKSKDEFSGPEDLRKAICGMEYWATLYVAEGASGLIENTLKGGTAGYDKTTIMTYIFNEARYSAVIDSIIASNLVVLASASRVAYSTRNWTSVITTPSQSTYAVFADPWHLQVTDIQPTSQGSRLIYNTLVIILILIQEFFYLGTLNQLYEVFKIYRKLSPHRIIFFRTMLSLFYCLFGSLFVTAAIWIFKAGWNVNGNQFALTWLVLWLFAHSNFLTFDVFTVWFPGPFVPMALIAWTVLNVTSILLPFELQSNFYRWAYVRTLPSPVYYTP